MSGQPLYKIVEMSPRKQNILEVWSASTGKTPNRHLCGWTLCMFGRNTWWECRWGMLQHYNLTFYIFYFNSSFWSIIKAFQRFKSFAHIFATIVRTWPWGQADPSFLGTAHPPTPQKNPIIIFAYIIKIFQVYSDSLLWKDLEPATLHGEKWQTPVAGPWEATRGPGE